MDGNATFNTNQIKKKNYLWNKRTFETVSLESNHIECADETFYHFLTRLQQRRVSAPMTCHYNHKNPTKINFTRADLKAGQADPFIKLKKLKL